MSMTTKTRGGRARLTQSQRKKVYVHFFERIIEVQHNVGEFAAKVRFLLC